MNEFSLSCENERYGDCDDEMTAAKIFAQVIVELCL